MPPLEILNQMIRHGFRLKEEVYVESVREARRIIAETGSVTSSGFKDFSDGL